MPWNTPSRRDPHAGRDNRRRSSSAAGYNARWQRVAERVRIRDAFLCQHCLKEGGMAAAVAEMQSRPLNSDGTARRPPVDHIIPGHARPDLFYDESNLQTLCERHNALKAVADQAKYGAARR